MLECIATNSTPSRRWYFIILSVILFRYYKPDERDIKTLERISSFFQGIAIAVFPEGGGACAWHDFGNYEYKYPVLVAIDWRNPVSATLILVKNSEQFLLLRSPGGKEVLESKKSPLYDTPPYLKRNDRDIWETQNRDIFNKTIQFLLMGGGNLSHVTHVRIPAKREQEVRTLAEHRRRIGKDAD